LMLQANPALTPNGVKAILEYTSQSYDGYNALTEGAGFLNAIGAVRLARFFSTAQPGDTVPVQQMWSRHIIWGNHMMSHGLILPDANAWAAGVTWGAAQTTDGDNIVWGQACPDTDPNCDNIVWGQGDGDNIVWGDSCVPDPIDPTVCDNIVWGQEGDDDNIVWGDACDGDDCENIVWGDSGGDNVVWGQDCDDQHPEQCDDNIVWGQECDEQHPEQCDDNIVWGQECVDANGNPCDNIVWGDSADENNSWVNPVDGSIYTAGTGDLPAWLTDEILFGLAPPAPQPGPGNPGPPLPPSSDPPATDGGSDNSSGGF